MAKYILKRLLFMVPTLFGIMVLNFIIVQAAPGGPVEQTIARIKGMDGDATERFTGVGASEGGGHSHAMQAHSAATTYRGAQGLDPEIIAEIEKMYGFDKPPLERFAEMMLKYVTFDFGESFFRNETVTNLVLEKMPVSISLGLWTTLIVYLISIPLGIKKAVSDGSRFDVASSIVITVAYAIPGFLFAILLIVLFAGGSYWNFFPLRGLLSENWDTLPWDEKILDYFWHLVLPITALVISGFATLSILTKNYFLEEIRKAYVVTARAKGCSETRVLYGHIFRNAMLVVIAGLPSAFIGILFTGSLLIEVIFSLDGLGYMGFQATLARDYPVMFGTLFFFGLVGLIVGLIGDVVYTLVDPRIDFEKRDL